MFVVNYGFCFVVVDGMGYVKWFECDGFIEVCWYRIGYSERMEGLLIFVLMFGLGDLVWKLFVIRVVVLFSSGEV